MKKRNIKVVREGVYIKINDNLYKCSVCGTKHPVVNDKYLDLYPFCKQCGSRLHLNGVDERGNCKNCVHAERTSDKERIKCHGKYTGHYMPASDWCNKYKKR